MLTYLFSHDLKLLLCGMLEIGMLCEHVCVCVLCGVSALIMYLSR